MAHPTPATKQLRQQRRYVLRLTDVHGKPYPITGGAALIAPGGEFEFPLPPQHVAYPDGARTGLHALADGTTQADEQGAGVPGVQISGTFGEGIRSNSLGVRLDGRQWQRAFEQFIAFYFDTQLKAARQRTPPAVLEWHDTYRNAHLIVTPQRSPRGEEDSTHPMRETYALQLTGLRRTDHAPKAKSALNAESLGNACPYLAQCRVDGIGREPGCPNARTA